MRRRQQPQQQPQQTVNSYHVELLEEEAELERESLERGDGGERAHLDGVRRVEHDGEDGEQVEHGAQLDHEACEARRGNEMHSAMRWMTTARQDRAREPRLRASLKPSGALRIRNEYTMHGTHSANGSR